MTLEQLKHAFAAGCPVLLYGVRTDYPPVEYKYVRAIVYERWKNGTVHIHAEVMDKNGNGVVNCPAENLEFKFAPRAGAGKGGVSRYE
jgi:hypothetical protein